MNKLKSFRYIIPTVIIVISIILLSQNEAINIKDIIQTNLSQGLRTVKITEEKIKIDDKRISINVKMPEIHCSNTDVERYINSYIRRDINEYINYKRQDTQLDTTKENLEICISYNLAFEDGNLLNIIITKNITNSRKQFTLEKDSYIFDLNTGQRIYLDNFLKSNDDYQEVISNYIDEYIEEHNVKVDRERIVINKNTDFSIIDGGIMVYFNPYKTSKDSDTYEFKIPSTIFKNKIKVLGTNNIVANVDTQTITQNNKYINSVINIPIIMTGENEIDKYINDKLREDIMQFYNTSEKEAKEYADELSSQGDKFIANVDFDVKKNSDNVLSINVTYYKYSGGAHGIYEDISYNLDMTSGKLIKLSDLFKTDVDYKKVIDNEIRKQIENIIKEDEQYKDVYQFKGINLENKFFIQDDNLVIYFDLYEIAPYAAGIPQFPININVINHILKPEYTNIFK